MEGIVSDKADSLIELAKLAASRHDERRKYEWKVSFAFWGLIIAAISKKSSLPVICPWFGIGVVLLYAFLWLRGVWVANENDKIQTRHFITQALLAMRDSSNQPSDPPPKISSCSLSFWFGFLRDWAMLFHLIVSIAVVITFFLFG
jgi:hypothetical protein